LVARSFGVERAMTNKTAPRRAKVGNGLRAENLQSRRFLAAPPIADGLEEGFHPRVVAQRIRRAGPGDRPSELARHLR
jgi:hypothetical protein